MKNNLNLNKYYENVYSQRGEDGILEYIFSKIGIKAGVFVEFGAWDGIYLSNSRNLIDKGWEGLFIESDKEKYLELKNNYKDRINIVCLNKEVSEKGKNSLDRILDKHYPGSIDFISIDVDGYDYYMFKSINKYIPKVFCIEGGKYIPPLYDKEIDKDLATQYVGQSLLMFQKIAQEKGHVIICFTQNIITVSKEYKHLFPVTNSLEDLYINGIKKHTIQDYEHMIRILERYEIDNDLIKNINLKELMTARK